jgi:pilus assembly protein Flp/PilA
MLGGRNMNILKNLWNDESGQGMAEYGLILALVAVVCIVAFQTLGEGITSKIDTVNTQLAPPAPAQ